MRICARALPRVVADGRDLDARSEMLMASMMGAVAFQKDLGAVHSCAHALSTVNDLHHGLANGLMIDHVMRFNRSAAAAKMEELARVAGVTDLVEWLVRLKEEIGIPARLAPLGVNGEHVPRLVDVAEKDTCHQTNPRPCSRGDFEQLFRAAL